MLSSTRASLLTGRNHHRVGAGQIAEMANDWDGYSGHIPKSSALTAEMLKDYGYSTAAWGKWHNTPAEETTAAGPFENWPTGLGFEYFYGVLAGEASHYEPNLVRNTTVVHVAMHDAFGMRRVEPVGDINGYAEQFFAVHPPAEDGVLQGGAVEKLHDHERAAVLLADVVNGADVGMV